MKPTNVSIAVADRRTAMETMEWHVAQQTHVALPLPDAPGCSVTNCTGDLSLELDDIPELSAGLASLDPFVKQVVSPNSGPVLGVPISFARLNTIIYHVKALQILATKAGLSTTELPSTLDDYKKLCDAYNDLDAEDGTIDGKDASGKILPKVIQSLREDDLAQRAGELLVTAFMTKDVVRGVASYNDAKTEIAAIIDMIDYIKANNCIMHTSYWSYDIVTGEKTLDTSGNPVEDENGNRVEDENGQPVVIAEDPYDVFGQGKSLFSVTADWFIGRFKDSGMQDGIDFKASSLRGSASPFTYVVEIIIGNKNTSSPEVTNDFLANALTMDAQVAYNQSRGGAPVLAVANPDTEITDPGVRDKYKLFQSAVQNNQLASNPTWLVGSYSANVAIPDYRRNETWTETKSVTDPEESTKKIDVEVTHTVPTTEELVNFIMDGNPLCGTSGFYIMDCKATQMYPTRPESE